MEVSNVPDGGAWESNSPLCAARPQAVRRSPGSPATTVSLCRRSFRTGRRRAVQLSIGGRPVSSGGGEIGKVHDRYVTKVVEAGWPTDGWPMRNLTTPRL